jgi:hypothetical protein
VYDLYGQTGVENMGSWHVGQKLQSPAEVRLMLSTLNARFAPNMNVNGCVFGVSKLRI